MVLNNLILTYFVNKYSDGEEARMMKNKKKFVTVLANSTGISVIQSCGKQHCGTRKTNITKVHL